MNRFLVLLCLGFMLLHMSGVRDAHAKSSENKAACEAWCSNNKPTCAFCDSNAFCGGRDYDIINSFKKGTGSWYACGKSRHMNESEDNERQCREWCNANSAVCARCTSDACGRDQKVAKLFGGRGENWKACEKNQAQAEAEAWCTDYTRTSGASVAECRVLKSGQSCPADFYEAEYMRITGARNYKVCVRRKVYRQRVEDCSGEATANIEKALKWLDTHYDTILTNYQLQPKEYRDRLAHLRMDRKFPKINALCRDNRDKCKEEANVQGWSYGGKKVYLCYNKKRNFCSLVRTIMHEAGHGAHADVVRGHSSGNPERFEDVVYQLGYRAEDLCRGDNAHGTNIVPPGSRSYDFNL